ncbi:MAG: SusC/RagA family TonB-linked outer membrane protein [Siphonobacter sp.]
MKINQVRYASVLFLLIFSAVAASAQQFSIKRKQATLHELFTEIEKQTHVHFHYDASELNLKRKYDFNHMGTLSEMLSELAALTQLTFRKEGNQVLVRVSARRVISGKVTDQANGEGIPGVSVRLSTGRVLTVTNNTGNYTCTVPMDDATQLEFRMIGMKTALSPPLGKSTTLDITMHSDYLQMEEVVVTNGYTNGTPKEEVIGSVSQLTSKELQVNRPIESVDKMLEGLAAGVYVETNTQLGTPVKINIRGQGTLTAIGSGRTTSTQPLFVIDGIPIQEQSTGDASTIFNNETLLNPIAGISPQDIATISVLKDASASAIYGANAANGVIIITTKSGQEGKTVAHVSINTGVSSFINRLKLLNGPEYYVLKREALINDGFTASQAAAQSGSSTINTDWLGLTNRQASYTSVNADVSGGKGGITYRFSGSYRKQQASSIGNDLQQMDLSLKVTNVISPKIKIGVTLSPSFLTKEGLDNYSNDAYLPPNLNPYDSDGNFTTFLGIPNPLAVLAQNENQNKAISFNGNANLHYAVFPGLTLSGVIGTNLLQGKQRVYKSALNATGSNVGGNLQIFDRQTLGWLGYMQGNYIKTFAEKHNMSVLLGFEAQDQSTSLLGGSGSGFTYDRIRELGQATTRTSSSSNQSNATVSYYAQSNYDYNKKYLFTASIRADQSSMFGGDKQLAINAAAGFGWILSKESFLKNNVTINFLKVRGSYGSTGNSRIGSYASRGLYNFSYGNYAGSVAAIPDGSSAPNPDLGWEKNRKLNIGIDATLWDRLSITAEYYRNSIRDLIANIVVPYETGYTFMSANTGSMSNQGVDVTLQTEFIRKKELNWRSTLTLSFNRNKVTSYNNGFTSLYADPSATSSEPNAAIKVGYSTSAIWGIRWAGVNSETGQEQFYAPTGETVDRTTIRSYASSTWIPLGDKLPKLQGGWVNTLTYKGFSLTANLLYSFGGNVMESTKYYADGLNLQNTNMSVNLLDRWQQPGDIAPVSKLSIYKGLVRNSSRYLHDLTYIKLSNLQLNYQIPASITQRLKLKQISAYLNGTNLGYWYREKSPAGRNGVREIRFTYPEARTFSAGLAMII